MDAVIIKSIGFLLAFSFNCCSAVLVLRFCLFSFPSVIEFGHMHCSTDRVWTCMALYRVSMDMHCINWIWMCIVSTVESWTCIAAPVWTCIVSAIVFGRALHDLHLDMHGIDSWVWICIASTIVFGHALYQLRLELHGIDRRVWTYMHWQSSLDMHCIDDCAWICIVSVIDFGRAFYRWLCFYMHCINNCVWICIVSLVEFGRALYWYFDQVWLFVCIWLNNLYFFLGRSTQSYIAWCVVCWVSHIPPPPPPPHPQGLAFWWCLKTWSILTLNCFCSAGFCTISVFSHFLYFTLSVFLVTYA